MPNPQNRDEDYRGSLNPKKWRPSYDTGEINDIITMQKGLKNQDKTHTRKARQSLTIEPIDTVLDSEKQFLTSNQNLHNDKFDACLRDFGATDYRKMRYAIETSSPD